MTTYMMNLPVPDPPEPVDHDHYDEAYADDLRDLRRRNEQLRAALEASNRWMIAERDSLYECITDSEGNIPDDEGQYLREMDKVIDANRAALAQVSPAPSTLRLSLFKSSGGVVTRYRDLSHITWASTGDIFVTCANGASETINAETFAFFGIDPEAS